MEAPLSSKLHVLEGWSSSLPRERRTRIGEVGALGQSTKASEPRTLFLQESMCASQTRAQHESPFSLGWFEAVQRQRHERQARWIPKLLEFSRHEGEQLLALGDGLGTDWLQYAKHGAEMTVCCSRGDQLHLARRNFELRGLKARFLFASPIGLPLEPGSMDVVCYHGLRQSAVERRGAVGEIYRVLKPGGKVIALLPAYYNIQYWYSIVFPWQKRLALPHEPETAFASGLSAREVYRLLASFTVQRVQKRHLRRVDVPHVWRWMPRSMLGRAMGRILVVKAFKPISAAMPATAQAASEAA